MKWDEALIMIQQQDADLLGKTEEQHQEALDRQRDELE